MLCPNCNREIPDNSTFCPECGYQIPFSDSAEASASSNSNQEYRPPINPNPPYDQGYAYQVQNDTYNEGDASKNGFAVSSLVVSLLCLLCSCAVGLPFSVSSLVFGIIGYKSQKKGMAVAGIVISVICIIVTVIAIIYAVAAGYAFMELISDAINGFENDIGSYSYSYGYLY